MIKKISKQYDNFANKFSINQRYENRTNITKFREQLNFNFKNKKVIDFGCGDGYELKFLKRKGAIVYGFDSSKEMVNLAKKNLKGEQIKEGLFEKVPFESNLFDFVISKYALQTSRNIEPIYKEIVRVLKKKGYLIFLVVHPLRQFIEKKKKTISKKKLLNLESLKIN